MDRQLGVQGIRRGCRSSRRAGYRGAGARGQRHRGPNSPGGNQQRREELRFS